jgi:hypothetical protein
MDRALAAKNETWLPADKPGLVRLARERLASNLCDYA